MPKSAHYNKSKFICLAKDQKFYKNSGLEQQFTRLPHEDRKVKVERVRGRQRT